jgi:hypothetical protein
VALSSSALADPTTADKERARDLMAQGREQRDQKDLASALKSFQAADAIMHVPTTALEVARTQQALGQLVEARETLVVLLRLPVSPSDPPPFADARLKAEALAKELSTQVPSLRIVVTSSDRNITPDVTIDDRPVVGGLDAPQKLNPGSHVIVARGGGSEATANVMLAPGETKEVDLRLAARPLAQATPIAPARPRSGGVPLVSWIGFGVGTAGLAVGSVTGVMAVSREGEIAKRCAGTECGPEVASDLDAARSVATISTIGFIVAGVGAAVGVVGLFVGRPSGAASGTTGRALPRRFELGAAGLRGTF